MNRRSFLLGGAAALAVGPSSVLAIANTTEGYFVATRKAGTTLRLLAGWRSTYKDSIDWDAFDTVYDFGNAGNETEACMNLAPYLQSGFIARCEVAP